MAVLAVPPYLQFFDDDGEPLAGGYVRTYAAGTTTPKATYTDQSASTANTNPVALDAAGRPLPGGSIWINGSYKFEVYSSADVLIRSTDNVTAFTDLAQSASAYFESFSGNGSQTVFTLSQGFGTDEKLLMIFVGSTIQNPSAYTINGTSLTFAVAPGSGTNNIQVWGPSLLAGAASAAAEAADASATAAQTAQTNAETAETNAETAETNAEAAQAAAEAAQAAAEAAQAAAEAVIPNIDFTLQDAALSAQFFG